MTGGSDTCSYVRVEPYRATPRPETVDVAGGLLFDDVAGEHVGGWEGEVASQLRFVEESVLSGLTHVLIRSPGLVDDSFVDRIGIVSDLVESRSGRIPPIGVVHFVLGEQSTPVRSTVPRLEVRCASKFRGWVGGVTAALAVVSWLKVGEPFPAAFTGRSWKL